MPFQFTHPQWLALLPVVWAWSIWLAWRTDVSISRARWAAALILRLAVALMMVLALAGLQWKKPVEGMNVFFRLDRSESIPSPQQEASRKLVNQFAAARQKPDQVGLLVFGTEAALESTASGMIDPKDSKVLAVVGADRTDIAGEIGRAHV